MLKNNDLSLDLNISDRYSYDEFSSDEFSIRWINHMMNLSQ